MGKFRDAETGEYISEEEAKTRDPKTWVEERRDTRSQQAELREIYKQCKTRVVVPSNTIAFNGTAVIQLSDLKRILNKFGANIEE